MPAPAPRVVGEGHHAEIMGGQLFVAVCYAAMPSAASSVATGQQLGNQATLQGGGAPQPSFPGKAAMAKMAIARFGRPRCVLSATQGTALTPNFNACGEATVSPTRAKAALEKVAFGIQRRPMMQQNLPWQPAMRPFGQFQPQMGGQMGVRPPMPATFGQFGQQNQFGQQHQQDPLMQAEQSLAQLQGQLAYYQTAARQNPQNRQLQQFVANMNQHIERVTAMRDAHRNAAQRPRQELDQNHPNPFAEPARNVIGEAGLGAAQPVGQAVRDQPRPQPAAPAAPAPQQPQQPTPEQVTAWRQSYQQAQEAQQHLRDFQAEDGTAAARGSPHGCSAARRRPAWAQGAFGTAGGGVSGAPNASDVYRQGGYLATYQDPALQGLTSNSA